MKKLSVSKLACGLMIGVFVPLGTASAADEHDRIQSHLGDGSPSQYFSFPNNAPGAQQETWSTSQGAQGPIRSDMTEDKRTDSEKEAARRAMDKQLYPLNAEGGY